jgi:hypothetical protein
VELLQVVLQLEVEQILALFVVQLLIKLSLLED